MLYLLYIVIPLTGEPGTEYSSEFWLATIDFFVEENTFF